MFYPSQHERSEATYVSIKYVYATEDVVYTCYFLQFLTANSSLYAITVQTYNLTSYI